MESSVSPTHPVEQAAESRDEFTAHSPFSNILIYVDGSEASMEASRVGIRVASVHGLPVKALYVIEEKTITEIAAISEDSREVVRWQMEDKGRRYLDYIEQLANHHGIACQRLVRRGIPHNQIANVARDAGIDLIVLGDGRVQSARRVTSGSLIDRVIEYAPCSVLVVRPS